MIKKSFESVGIGVDYLNRDKIYWYRLKSLQQEIDRSPLPNVASLTRSVFNDAANPPNDDQTMPLRLLLPPLRRGNAE